METQSERAPDLGAVLGRHREQIAASWTKKIYQLPSESLEATGRDRTYDLTLGSVVAISQVLATGDYAPLKSHLDNVNRHTLEGLAGIEEVVETLLILADAALPVILGTYPPGSRAMQDAIGELDAILRWMTSYLTGRFSAEKSRRAEAMLQTARLVGGTLNLGQVLDNVAQALAAAVGDYECAFYLVKAGELLPLFRQASAATDFESLVAQALEQGKPVTGGEGTCAAAIPFLAAGRPVAAAVLCPGRVGQPCEDGGPFDRGALDLAWGIAGIAAPVIENARTYQQVEELMVRRERDRLAGELHDNLAQALSALNLQVSLTDSLIEAGEVEEARAKLRTMKAVLQDTYVDVREAIFNLRSGSSVGGGLVPSLREYLNDYRQHYGLDVQLEVDPGGTLALPAGVELQAMRIVQEALANVRKHSGVGAALLSIGCQDGGLAIRVEDEGRGFDAAAIGGGQRYGLSIMAERAESAGGWQQIETQPGQGTCVTVWLPAAPSSQSMVEGEGLAAHTFPHWDGEIERD